MIDFNLVFLDLVISDIETLRFEGTKAKISFFEGSWTPPT